MQHRREVAVPTLVRIKPGALDRLGIYLRRERCGQVGVFYSEGLPLEYLERVQTSLQNEGVALGQLPVSNASLEEAQRIFAEAVSKIDAVVGLGGGKALDVAKYIAFLLQKPYFAVPTSLSNDGFSSPQSSLTIGGRRVSLPSAMPFAVIVDTDVCLNAPIILWLSGVGDLVSKITAVRDWKLAYHRTQTPVDDFAALLSDSTVFQFIGNPNHSLEGVRLMATALMLNGTAMAMCGSSRPASGSEHLISHALDAISDRPRLHGLQVGMATYLVSHLHGAETDRLRSLFDLTQFWQGIEQDPFSRAEWREAISLAPSIKDNFYTILSESDYTETLCSIIENDACLQACFVD